MAAYWRIYWPTQMFGIVGYLPVIFWIRVPGGTYAVAGGMDPATQFLLQVGLGAIGLFLFIHRFLSSCFRRFSIHLILDSPGQKEGKLILKYRSQVWFFIWWRQIVAGIIAAILAAPLNSLISLFGLRAVLGINISYWISTLAVVLAVGPILLKMLIGHQFKDFHLEVRRFPANAALAGAPSASTPS